MQHLLSISPEENHAIQQQMLEADSLLVEWQAVLKTATDELNHQVALIVSDLKTELSAITVTEHYEIDMKAVLQVLLETHNLDDELSDAQQVIIETIANKCRLSGGYAVVLARGFLDPELEYPQDADCVVQSIQVPETNSEGGAYYSDKSEIRVFPNPATDLVNVQIMQPFEKGHATVFNSQGKEVKAINLIGQVSPLKVSGLPGGLYILKVQLDGKSSMRQTFIVKP
ncbi:MAG: T9SS type A sorting domain-containing protein [Phaeodactylibacter sp.]|nr:T9SS type A sorting domain-containing protein [Phaeodactylibacter sp.]